MQPRTPGPVRRILLRLITFPAVSEVLAGSLPGLDRLVFRVTAGRTMLSSAIAGLPVVMLTTVGARSGRERTVPVLGVPVDGALVVIASNWGAARHPAWYLNLTANPEARVAVDDEVRTVRAREAAGGERERLWALGLAVYPGWAAHERRAGERTIPVMVLEPLPAPAA